MISSLSKVSALHLDPLQNPHPHHLHVPALACHELATLFFAQEDEQLKRLQDVNDSLYAVSLAVNREIIIFATSLVKLLTGSFLRKHWQNYVRTWVAQPARKTRSLVSH